MKGRIVTLVVIASLTLACQVLAPGTERNGIVIDDCSSLIQSVMELKPAKTPDSFRETGVKTGAEFDVNDYFKALTHLSMEDGYTLDYVYIVDFLGSFPRLFARPADQPPYASIKDVPEGTQLGDFRAHLRIEDVEQGYFEYVLADVMASQFYLVWHANYDDTQVVCNAAAAKRIMDSINGTDFGAHVNPIQQAQIRLLRGIEPAVRLTADSAIVEVTTFTKWGGFFRRTYTVSRSFPHKVEMDEENLVEYDCGIMF